jgi:hypothetical protein
LNPSKDYYAILGLQKSSSLDDIRTSWIELIKIVHPDKGGTVESFREVQEAYEVLSNSATRAKYDITYVPTMIAVYNQGRSESNERVKTKLEVIPHALYCSCDRCLFYWATHREEYFLTKPYAKQAWYRGVTSDNLKIVTGEAKRDAFTIQGRTADTTNYDAPPRPSPSPVRFCQWCGSRLDNLQAAFCSSCGHALKTSK